MRSRPSQSLETRDDEEVTDEKESGESEGSTSSVFSDTDSGIWDGNEDQDDEGLDQNDNHESMEYVDEEEREEGEEQEAEHEKLAVKENAKPSVFRPKPSKCNINPDGDGRHATPLTTKPVGGAVSKEVRLLLQKRDKKHAISIKSSLAEANNYWHYSFDHLNRNVLLALKRRLDRLTVKSAETKDKNFTTTEASSMDVSGSRTRPSNAYDGVFDQCQHPTDRIIDRLGCSSNVRGRYEYPLVPKHHYRLGVGSQ